MRDKRLMYCAPFFLGLAIVGGFIFGAAPVFSQPVVAQSFAAPDLAPGETWKIYLRATSPDANMKYIFASIQQAGVMAYPLSITRLKGENQKDLSGYLILTTVSAGRPLDFVTLKLTINIRDDKGRFSEPVEFPLTFNPRASAKTPPEGVFQEKDLGPIMISLRPVGEDGGASFGQ